MLILLFAQVFLWIIAKPLRLVASNKLHSTHIHTYTVVAVACQTQTTRSTFWKIALSQHLLFACCLRLPLRNTRLYSLEISDSAINFAQKTTQTSEWGDADDGSFLLFYIVSFFTCHLICSARCRVAVVIELSNAIDLQHRTPLSLSQLALTFALTPFSAFWQLTAAACAQVIAAASTWTRANCSGTESTKQNIITYT